MVDSTAPTSRFNKGHEFWYNMNADFLEQLDQQYDEHELNEESSVYSSETLFGLAQAYTNSMDKHYVEKVLKYMRSASFRGSIPAQAIYPQVLAALDEDHHLPTPLATTWWKNGVADGFLFCPDGALSKSEYRQ